MSTPFFYSLCDSGAVSPCIFSVFLTNDGGEIQLGGYVPESIDNTSLVYTPLAPPCSTVTCETVAYTIYVSQLRVVTSTGASYIVYSSSMSTSKGSTTSPGLGTVVDSGVSCTLLPTAVPVGNGQTTNVYKNVNKYADSKSKLYVKINGREFQVPLSDCYFPNSQPDLLTLGDPFFRNVLVIHNLTDRGNVTIGFANQNSKYNHSSGGVVASANELRQKISTWESNHTFPPPEKLAAEKLSKLCLWRKRAPPFNARVDTISTQTPDGTIYYTILSAGTPRQSPFIVQIDTGSSLTAIFSDDHPPPPAWQIALFSLAVIFSFGALVGLSVWYCKRRRQWEPHQTPAAAAAA